MSEIVVESSGVNGRIVSRITDTSDYSLTGVES